MARTPTRKDVTSLTHDTARRINVPTAEMAELFRMQEESLGEGERAMTVKRPRPLGAGEGREREADLDPQIVWNGVRIRITAEQMQKLAETGEIEIGDAQLVWRGKDRADWSDLVVNAPPIYVQEKVHPKAIIDDLKRMSDAGREASTDAPDLFTDFNGLIDPEARAEFYSHAQHWTNRMILGDSLQVMASLAEREALRGKVQCIYFDPPYGIKFNSNWQVSTLSRDVKDGKADNVTREPEQVKAFRDTWKDGIHSYLTYLRDRLQVARELLTESGSIFVQIGDENVHRVRAVMDEVFGEENYVAEIAFAKTASTSEDFVNRVFDYVVFYAKNKQNIKFRQTYIIKTLGGRGGEQYNRLVMPDGKRNTIASVGGIQSIPYDARVYRIDNLTSTKPPGSFPVENDGRIFLPGKRYWSTGEIGMRRLAFSSRLEAAGNTLSYVRYLDDFRVFPHTNVWTDTVISGFGENKSYVVQTAFKVIERCILMTTDPGDLVLDPTCGSGTTATVAEQWGRRWITIDTSRVALALARTRLMSARYPYYLLADSADGRAKEAELTKTLQPDTPTHGDIALGFVYDRAAHITLKSIANNAEIDVIWERWKAVLEPLREKLNVALGRVDARKSPSEAGENGPWEEWEIPREPGDPWPEEAARAHAIVVDPDKLADSGALKTINRVLGRHDTRETLPKKPYDLWTDPVPIALHAEWWKGRIARQKEIDASIERAADVEYLYDRPYEDKTRVRVAGPFTVESLSPHRVATAYDDRLAAEMAAGEGALQREPASMVEADFGAMVLENLKSAGVQQLEKGGRIAFSHIEPWPGEWLAAVGSYAGEGGNERRAGILIGPEFGTLARSQITAAAREAADARFDTLIACAFNFEAQASDLTRLGPLAILKARMNPDLHMAGELKNTGKGNLFVVFGEPDVDVSETADGELQVKVNGVDVFDPSTGDIRSDGIEGIAAWFIDTDYNEESFFVRHAYFLGSAKSGGADPYSALKTALKAEIDKDTWETLYSDVSRPFPRPRTGRIAVKVINHFGDEVLKVFGV